MHGHLFFMFPAFLPFGAMIAAVQIVPWTQGSVHRRVELDTSKESGMASESSVSLTCATAP